MRIRTIKPEFWMNEDLARLGPHAQLLFIGLWQCSDKEGRLEDRPVRLQAAIFPYYPDVNVEAILDGLSGAGFIRRYEVEGRRLIWICTFKKHQRIHGTEAETASHLPAPPEGPGAPAPPPPLCLIPPESCLNARPEELALTIYGRYPRRVGKPAAVRAIVNALKTVPFDDLLRRTEAYATAVNGQNPDFIPYPSTWFNQQRYNDDPATWERHENTGASDTPGARLDRFTAGDGAQYDEAGKQIDMEHPFGLPAPPPELLGEVPPPDA